MTENSRETPDVEAGNPFITLRQLLSDPLRVTVGTLATAIENAGIYSWDKYGRFKKFDKETAEFQHALELLATVHRFEDEPYPGQGEHPLDESGGPDDPFALFGWAHEVTPNFTTIRSGQTEGPGKKQRGALRAETTYQHIIAALLQYIAGTTTGVKKHPSFSSEADLILTLALEYQGKAGLSQRNLQQKFPEAKRAFNSV